MKDITIEDLVTAVRLVKKDTCEDYATTAAVAKMLGVRKMDVLLLLEDNARLVRLEQRFRQKVRRRAYKVGGKTFHGEAVVNGASLGLCIIGAWTAVEDNPWNPEWLEAAKRLLAKTLWLSEVNNYGEILGHCFHEDKRPSDIPSDHLFADNRRNDWLWRNTPEKLKAAKALGGCSEHTFIKGGFGDSYSCVEPYAATQKELDILRENGWTIIG